jgi:hypothetical protein
MSLLRVNSLGGGSGGAYIQRPLGLWVAAGGHERVIGPPGGDDRGYASVDPSSWMVSIQCLSCMLIFHSTCICAPARLVQTFVPRHAVTFCHTHTHTCVLLSYHTTFSFWPIPSIRLLLAFFLSLHSYQAGAHSAAYNMQYQDYWPKLNRPAGCRLAPGMHA